MNTWYEKTNTDFYYADVNKKIIGSVIGVPYNLYWNASIEGTSWSEKHLDLNQAKLAVENQIDSIRKNDTGGIILIGSLIVMAMYFNWTQLSKIFSNAFGF